MVFLSLFSQLVDYFANGKFLHLVTASKSILIFPSHHNSISGKAHGAAVKEILKKTQSDSGNLWKGKVHWRKGTHRRQWAEIRPSTSHHLACKPRCLQQSHSQRQQFKETIEHIRQLKTKISLAVLKMPREQIHIGQHSSKSVSTCQWIRKLFLEPSGRNKGN